MINNINSNDLSHHGIPGMKWGIRRFQNKDGSLTNAGRKRADKLKRQYTELTGKQMRRLPTKKAQKDAEKSGIISREYKNGKNKLTVKLPKDMSDEELAKSTNRMNLEKNYLEALRNLDKASPKQVSKGRNFVSKINKDILVPVATDVGKQLFKSLVVKMVNDGLKLDKEFKIYTNNKKKD